MRLAERHPHWALGFCDECWWSRLARPALHHWGEVPLRMVEQTVANDDTAPKALACYGLLLRHSDTPDDLLLRFCAARPVSAVTTQYLAWCCDQLAARGMTALLLIWDNAPWHVSRAVRRWIRAHNRAVKAAGSGVRILACELPIKSPWLNPIEPKWVHGKRAVSEPDRVLAAAEVEDRVYQYFGCSAHGHLTAQSAA
jgi:hypothetical protein